MQRHIERSLCLGSPFGDRQVCTVYLFIHSFPFYLIHSLTLQGFTTCLLWTGQACGRHWGSRRTVDQVSALWGSLHTGGQTTGGSDSDSCVNQALTSWCGVWKTVTTWRSVLPVVSGCPFRRDCWGCQKASPQLRHCTQDCDVRLGDPRQWTEVTKITAAERVWQNLVAVPAGQKPRLPVLIGWCGPVRSVSVSVRASLARAAPFRQSDSLPSLLIQ